MEGSTTFHWTLVIKCLGATCVIKMVELGQHTMDLEPNHCLHSTLITCLFCFPHILYFTLVYSNISEALLWAHSLIKRCIFRNSISWQNSSETFSYCELTNKVTVYFTMVYFLFVPLHIPTYKTLPLYDTCILVLEIHM